MTSHTRRSAVAFEPRTGGLAMLPTRLVLAVLAQSRRSWALLFVVVPLGFLAGSLLVSPRIADGIVGICGFLGCTLWAVSHYGYDRQRVRIDPGARSLTVIYENAPQWNRTVDLGRIESVSVRTPGSLAFVRVEGHALDPLERFTLPEPFLVPTESVPTALAALEAAGVTVPEAGSADYDADGRSLETTARLVLTPLVLVGAPLLALLAFGRSILFTNGAVIMAVLGLVAIGRELR